MAYGNTLTNKTRLAQAEGRQVAAAEGRQVLKSSTGKGKLKGKIEREVMEAEDLMSKRDYAGAADRYHDAIQKTPKNANAVAGLGLALGKQFKLDAADEQFDKALQLEPDNAVAHVGKALVAINRLQSSSVTIQKQRDSMLKNAEAECRQALTKDPYSPEAHYYLGQSLREQGRFDEAANEFNEAIKADDKMSEAYSGLGNVKLAQGSTQEAAAAFKQAIQAYSGNSTAHYGLGVCYKNQGQLDDALKELNTSLYQNPNSAPCHLAFGEVYAAQGNTVAAVQEFEKAKNIKPEYPDAYLHVADIRDARGDTELAIAELRSGLELMPNNPDLHQHIGDDNLRLEKLDDAIKEYEWVTNNSPGNAAAAAKGLTRAYYLKSQKESSGAFLMSNDYETAKHQLEKAIALNPDDMELRLAAAKIRAMSGETVDLKSVGTPRTDGERVAYAEALLAQNNFKDSQDQMNTVIGNARDAKQTFAVADLALMIKDLDSAEAAYKKAASYPGGEERAKRGLDMVTKDREKARKDLTLADDLAKRKQLSSAVDKYHEAIYDNPRTADARINIANTLEQLKPQKSTDLREAIVQLKAYIALTPTLPPKELEKLNKRMTNLEQKAYKIDQKAKAQAAKAGR
jgi:tetratricopeptide (TPR) repeat protein